VRVYVINGSRNGLNTTQHPPSLGSRAGPDIPTNVQAVLRAGISYARTVPGSRLGPDLPRPGVYRGGEGVHAHVIMQCVGFGVLFIAKRGVSHVTELSVGFS